MAGILDTVSGVAGSVVAAALVSTMPATAAGDAFAPPPTVRPSSRADWATGSLNPDAETDIIDQVDDSPVGGTVPAGWLGWTTTATGAKASATGLTGMENEISISLPEADIDSTDQALFSDREHAVIRGFLRVIEHEAARSFVRTSKLEISRFYDPEDDSEEIVIAQTVPLPPRAAMRYWDSLGFATSRWVETLTPALQRIANERIAVDVRWNVSS